MAARPISRLATAGLIASLAGLVVAGSVAAQAACSVTVTPSSVAVGQQFTVSPNFGGASIFLVRGAGAGPAENATPNATTPQGGPSSVTFTAEAGDEGTWTVWALIPASECGGSAPLTVTAATTPSTSTASGPGPLVALVVALVGLATVVGLMRMARSARSSR